MRARRLMNCQSSTPYPIIRRWPIGGRCERVVFLLRSSRGWTAEKRNVQGTSRKYRMARGNYGNKYRLSSAGKILMKKYFLHQKELSWSNFYTVDKSNKDKNLISTPSKNYCKAIFIRIIVVYNKSRDKG